MAKMIPPMWEDRNGSRAEGLIFRKLRDETPDDWYAIHSVGLIGHEFKSWTEIDFVLVGPFGVLCFEVKGGRIALKDGHWSTGGHRLKESPFQQAGGGAAALRSKLRDSFPQVKKALVEYAVVFPDVRFEARGPSVEQGLVYDDRDLGRPIEDFVDRVVKHWRAYRQLDSGKFRPLSKADRSAVVAWVAPNFDLVPTLSASVERTEAELDVLTQAQTRALRGMWESDRVLVKGGAGTGKTLLAAEEARRMDADGKRVLFCCRSVPLSEYLERLLEDTKVEVRALEPLMWDLVRRSGRESRLPPADAEDLFAVFLPEQALEGAVEMGFGRYDALVLDEAQDLLFEAALDLFDVLLEGNLESGVWRVFLDHKQRMFASVDPKQWERLAKLAETQFGLVDNCRNTPQIATITALLAALEPDGTLASDGPGVETRFVSNEEAEAAEVAELVEKWTRDGLHRESLVILGIDNEPSLELTTRLGPLAPVRLSDARPSQGQPIWASVEDYKGLEASAVIVTGIRDLVSPEMLRRAYVGCSRARSLLAVILPENAQADFAVRAREFERQRGDRDDNRNGDE